MIDKVMPEVDHEPMVGRSSFHLPPQLGLPSPDLPT